MKLDDLFRYLIESGYPMLAPQRQDRERLHRMVGGPVPRKVVAFESRVRFSSMNRS